ncbi:hypothetical protein, partial [Agrobacterium pusense]|uniref:hypothetical protein n=1 Tax=Agrobacterium pusense TaxID=648995 RepID=UPI002867DD5D
ITIDQYQTFIAFSVYSIISPPLGPPINNPSFTKTYINRIVASSSNRTPEQQAKSANMRAATVTYNIICFGAARHINYMFEGGVFLHPTRDQ